MKAISFITINGIQNYVSALYLINQLIFMSQKIKG